MTEHSSERRLFTIRNLEAFETSEGPAESVYEFEVIADCRAHGRAQIGPFLLAPWDVGENLVSGRRSLVLRIKNYLSSETSEATRKGFFHGASMPAEFVSLAGTLLRRRLRLGPVIRKDDAPLRLALPSPSQDIALTNGVLNLPDLSEHLGLIRRLPPDLHEAFILTCRFYQQGLDLIDDKPDLAYLSLVSAIEVLSSRLPPLPAAESDLKPQVLKDINRVSDPEVRASIIRHFLEADYKIARNFSRFILDHTENSFWESAKENERDRGLIVKSEMDALLKRIYNQRSKTLHAGEPFPPNLFAPRATPNSEIDRRKELVVGNRRWTETQFLPYPDFFERLVHHVLMVFLRRHADAPVSPQGEG